MKQIYLLLLIGLFSVLKTDAQAPRRVLVEEFTQASCPPCALYNPKFHAVIFSPGNETKAGLLCYQVNWPGSDPMNAQNASEVAARVTYYAVTGVPDCFADGGVTEANKAIFHGNISVFAQTDIDRRYAVTSPLEMTVNHTLRQKLDSVTIDVSIKNVSAADLPDNYTVQTLLIEKTIDFKVPPGTNGELEFYSVMRKMIPNASGVKLGILAAGATKTLSYTIAVPTYIYSIRNLGAIAFVQNTTKKEIMQSAESYPKPMPAGSTFIDLKAESQVLSYTGLCDPNVTFNVNLINDGTDSIRTVSLDLLLNNVKQGTTKIDTVNLPSGSSYTHEFKNINLKSGKNQLNFRINNVNGVNNKDIDKLNQTGPHRFLFNVETTPYATEMHESFEVSARGIFPTHSYLNNTSSMSVFPAAKDYFNDPDEVGGFGNSTYSLFWDFYFGPANTEVEVFWDKLNLSSSTNTHLMVSRAYAQLDNEDATFTIEASNDCGANWTTVYYKAGSDLASVGPRPAAYFAPLANEWARDTVSMASFDGSPEVLIRLKGFNPSSGSNLMFIDDIDIASLVVATDNPGILSGVSVYPNPVHQNLNVVVTSSEVSKATIQMFDLNGKAVGILAKDLPLREGVNAKSFNVSNYNPGLYSMKISTEKGVRITKVSIN
jgi:hypothetical protein